MCTGSPTSFVSGWRCSSLAEPTDACVRAGPSAYNVGGRAVRAHSANSTLKGAERFKDLGAKTRAGFPGPGQYAVPAGVGRQAVSTKRSTRMVGFSTADRDASSKVQLQHLTCMLLSGCCHACQ